MKPLHFLPTVLCLVSLILPASGQIQPFEEDCIRLTISDSLVRLIEDSGSGVSSDADANLHGIPYWNGECLTLPMAGGSEAMHGDSVARQMVWNGQFDNDTVHLHFYFHYIGESDRYSGQRGFETSGKLALKTFYISVQEIIDVSPYRTTYLKLHLRNDPRFAKHVDMIEVHKRIKRKN